MNAGFGRRGRAAEKSERVVSLSDRRPRRSAGQRSGKSAQPSAATAVLRTKAAAILSEQIGTAARRNATRSEIATLVEEAIDEVAKADKIKLDVIEHRDMITSLLNECIAGKARDGGDRGQSARPKKKRATKAPPAAPEKLLTAAESDGAVAPSDGPVEPTTKGASKSRASVEVAKEGVQDLLMERIDVSAASELPRGELAQQISEVVQEILAEQKIQLNLGEQRDLVTLLLNDMLGLGPLEPLLSDPTITDILVNGPKQVYVERNGKLELTDIEFRDNKHVMNIATRIVTRVGRRVDEASPIVDARLEDGSRVNVITLPLAIDGTSISIRKFAKQKITLETYERQRNMSPQMATVLRIAARSRCNILISGGTGSGKTTLLNALSQMIDHGERIVTIEDAAELQLQQPHVVRLETRPPNLEGQGEITMRDLVKNALRMRPDRIILGEVRGDEALDMLQAMNTGHEGSMGTVHANSPREALTRLENMIGMGGINLSPKATRTQICDALDIVVQVSRMRDGIRRIVSITEVLGMEGEIVTTQELFAFRFQGEDADGRIRGVFENTGLRPHFAPKADYFGLQQTLMEAIG